MYRARFNQRKASEAPALREVAIRRKSHWLSNVLGWLGAAFGAFAVVVLVSGMQHAAKLPTTPRPNIGPGLSEGTTAGIGAMIFGFGLSLIAFALVGLALLHAKNRRRTLMLSVPAVLCILLLLSVELWAT